ncbi:MAG: serine/threonine protein kinase [Myxococcales bacterium]|nr:serine/threonine protein kinase [Myxococcales bacterium]
MGTGDRKAPRDGSAQGDAPVDIDATRALTTSRGRPRAAPLVDTLSTAHADYLDAGERAPAEHIDRFTIVRQLGAGGMGVVYQAHDPDLDRAVAIKLIRTTRAGPDAQLRMLREAQALARLAHPNVVAVHDVGVHQNDLFIVMEYVPAVTLGDWVRESTPTWREIVRVFIEAGRGLAAAHEADIVHRDFKPSNVLVRRDDGRAQVVDFGLARAHEADALHVTPAGASGSRSALAVDLTETGALMGTPAYMSPEQYDNARALDDRSDQFSFCVALWEALYGQRPFSGDTLHQLSASVSAGALRPPPPSAQAPRWLQPVLRRGLAVDPAARWPSMHELIAALGRDPGKTALRWVSGAALLGAGLTIGGLSFARPGPDPCEEVAAAIDGVWNDARAQALETAFAGTQLAFAGEMAARVSTRVDTYAEGWRAAQLAACHLREDPLYAERNTCLARRRSQLDGTLELLTGVDAEAPGIVEHADEIAAKLPDVSLCNNVELLRAGGARVPASAEELARVEQARPHLLRADFFLKAYLLDQAAAELDAAEQLELTHGPVVAELMYLRASLALRKGEVEEAAEGLDRAAAKALAVAHDTLLIDAWLLRASLLAQSSARPADAHRWLDLAEGALTRFGLDEDDRVIQVFSLRGLALQHDAQFERAHARLEHARRLAEQRWSLEDPRLADILLTLAHVMARRGDAIERVEQFYEMALSILTKAYGEDHPALSYIHLGLANMYVDSSDRIEDAEASLERATSTYGASSNHLLSTQVLIDTTRTRLALVRGNLEEALVSATRATENCETRSNSPSMCADAWSALGTIEFGLREFSAARDSFSKALALSVRSHGNDSLAAGLNLGNLGETLLELGNLEAAVTNLEHSVAVLREIDGIESQYFAVPLKGLGKAYLSQNSPADAVPALEEAVTLLARGTIPNELADARFALARALADATEGPRPERAIEEALAALELYRELGVDFEPAAAEVADWLGS